MDKLKRLLEKDAPRSFGIAGALLFLLLFYTLGVAPRCGRCGCRPISITTK